MSVTRSPLGYLRALLARTEESEPAWSVVDDAMRFTRTHDGSNAIDVVLRHTKVTIAAGARIGRGTRIALLGGEVHIESGCVIGESVDVRPNASVRLAASCVVEDFAQLQSDSAALMLGESVRVERFTRLWAHTGSVQIGAHTTIGASCTFIGTGGGISIAEHCDFTHAATLDSAGGRIELKTRSGVGPHSILYGHGGLRIGSGVAIAGQSMCVAGNHCFDNLDVPIRAQGIDAQPIDIGDDVWIGAQVVVLAGARIGNGCVIAAGAVVRGDVAAKCVVAGVPARVISTRGGGAASLSTP